MRQPTTVSSVGVYWFDDTGRGQCRVPASWRVLYRDGKAWKPAHDGAAYQAVKDKFDVVKFAPVTTDALRLEVQLQPNYSGGILEWRVGVVE